MARPKTRRRAPFVLTVAALSSAIPACGGSTRSDGAGGSGGTGGQGCPTALPASGTSCAGSGDCYYERCGSLGEADMLARCVGGRWEVTVGGTCNPPPPQECPASHPVHGSACYLPNGKTCSYPTSDCCPDQTATCKDGVWDAPILSCNPPPPEPCPAEPPQAGDLCLFSDCLGLYQACTYGDCGGQPEVIATCGPSGWEVQKSQCAPPPCEGLSACECFDRPDCQAVSDSCICPCDYVCPGDPPCVCACGGGKYLGCEPA